MDKISVVVPCYNEEEALPVYYKEMCRVMDEMKDVVFELIFVDDGSSDNSLHILKKYETLEQKDQVILDEENIDIEIIQNDYVNIQDEVIRHKVDKLALDIYAYLIR